MRIKYFQFCSKTGRIVGLNMEAIQSKLLFPLLGMAAIIWFLLRVVPKPSRASYPCQKIAASLAGSSIGYFVSILGGCRFFDFLVKNSNVNISLCCLLSHS